MYAVDGELPLARRSDGPPRIMARNEIEAVSHAEGGHSLVEWFPSDLQNPLVTGARDEHIVSPRCSVEEISSDPMG